MNASEALQPPDLQHRVAIAPVAPEEQRRRIDAAVAARACEIFEKRGGASWHELEDWRQAESEIRSKLCFGMTTLGHSIFIGTDAAGFEPGTLEVWTAPREVTICGRSPSLCELARDARTNPSGHMVFRRIHLPCLVDGARVRVAFHGSFLEIELPKRAVNRK